MLSVNNNKLLPIILTTFISVVICACVPPSQDSENNGVKIAGTTTAPEPPKEDEIESFLKNNEAIINTISNKTPNTIKDCILNEIIHKFRLPEHFYQIDDYQSTGKYIRLINPMTNQQGITILIRPTENISKIELYDNGIKTISAAWRQMPEKCK